MSVKIELAIMGFLLGLWIIIIGGFIIMGYCHFNPSYYEDSMCFDTNYRCEIECSRYDLKFNNQIDNCMCDCGTAQVSICSGIMYSKVIK